MHENRNCKKNFFFAVVGISSKPHTLSPLPANMGGSSIHACQKNGLKVLTNEKRGGLKVVVFDRSLFKLFTLRFSNKSVQAHPLRGLKQLSEPYFCHLKSIIVCK
jgi:hypothetical protein